MSLYIVLSFHALLEMCHRVRLDYLVSLASLDSRVLM